uniref:Mu-like prophage host-nuclease inhibitor protein Gam n=1 Tax=Candidatus Kentrum sp. TC TaxID=2126339 RepID=A0A450YW58_9GAMM|nr:MAG: Mu-like prophage host-nuclease inhibitor protein Gam [Candidatus Kentron sp. TC]
MKFTHEIRIDAGARKASARRCKGLSDARKAIAELGALRRRRVEIQDLLSEEFDRIAQSFSEELRRNQNRRDALTAGVAEWCEANRAEILEKGKKTANLGSGKVSWRNGARSVVLTRDEAEIIRECKRGGLLDLIAIRESIDKSAVLKNPGRIEGVEGVSIARGEETFRIEPFEPGADIR